LTNCRQFSVDQSTQPIKALSIKKETPAERMQRLKATADATGRHFIHVYLEDEKHRQGHQR
jgi:hypothetical protein